MSRTVKLEGGTGAAQANASQPTQEHQEQQRNYAFENQTRGAAQLRAGDPMDFGLIPFHKDPMDEQIQIRRELMGVEPPSGSATPARGTQVNQLLGIPTGMIQRTMPVTDAELAYAQRWQAQEQQVMFDQAVASMFDLTNPAERDRVMKLFPGYFARQRAFVDSKFAVMRKFVDISMTGIQSEEDAKFVYNVKLGLIQLPMGYANFKLLTQAMNPENGKATTAIKDGTLVQRGPFNIYQYVTATQASSVAGYEDAYKAYPFHEPDTGRGVFSNSNFWGPVDGANPAKEWRTADTIRNRY